MKVCKKEQALLNACLDKETSITVSGDEEEVEGEQATEADGDSKNKRREKEKDHDERVGMWKK